VQRRGPQPFDVEDHSRRTIGLFPP
jgi:hypothetical protein